MRFAKEPECLRRCFLWLAALSLLGSLTVAQTVGGTQEAKNPEFSSRLTLLESLRSTLANEPQLHIQQQQVEISRALKQQATGQFDLALGGSFSQARTNSPLTQAERALIVAEGFAPTGGLAQNLSILSLQVTKPYRTGVQVGSIYQTTRTTDNLSTIQGTNVSRIAFQVVLPLLRGRGRAAVGAQEAASSEEVKATLLDLNQMITVLLATTADSYWNAVAAEKQLEVARSSEQRGKTYVDTVHSLIQADRVPRADINQATANLVTRTADRIAAEQNLVQAQQQLFVAMGLDAAQVVRPYSTLEDFPAPDLQRLPVPTADAIASYVQLALRNRADYLAAQRRVEESQRLLVAARNALKPRLDLSFDLGGSGLSEGTAPAQFINSPYHQIQGLDASAAITYSFPIANNLAKGELRQAQATLTQAQLRAADVSRRVASTVVTAVNGVINAARQLDQTRESVKFFDAALQGEREKFGFGFNSLVDVLTVEDRLTAAMNANVNAELNYALALAELRSDTGTIVEPDKEVHSVDPNLFFTVP